MATVVASLIVCGKSGCERCAALAMKSAGGVALRTGLGLERASTAAGTEARVSAVAATRARRRGLVMASSCPGATGRQPRAALSPVRFVRMDRARVAVVCGVLAALIGMAGVLAVVRHDDRVVQVAAEGLPVVPPTEVVPPTPEPETPEPEMPEPEVPVPSPDPAPQPHPEAHTPPAPPPDETGPILPTHRTPQPATKPTFDPAAYDITAVVEPAPDAQARGHAGAVKVSPTLWRVTVVLEGLLPDTEYSLGATRSHPNWGPTPCEFTATGGGWGTCTGEVYVTEGARLRSVSLMTPA